MPFLDPDAVARALAPRVVVDVEDLGGAWAPVCRAVLDDGTAVVVKERRRRGQGWGYAPDNLRNERAALELCRELGLDETPHFIAGDDDEGVVVMTDVGPGRSLEELLLDPTEADAAHAGLIEHGRTLGTIHAATATRAAADGFVARRSRMPPDILDQRLAFVTFAIPPLWAETKVHAASLGFGAPTAATDDDVEELWAALAEPGPWLALTHLDASPQNCVLADGRAKLVDFEGAAMRHLGLDASFLRFPFPSYGRWGVLPEPARAAMESAYRAALVEGGLEVAGDDRSFDDALAVGCAALVVVRMHRLPKIATDDDEALRRRTQAVSAVGVLTAASERAHRFRALAGWYGDVADEMRNRWAEARQSPRGFAAFEGGDDSDSA